MEYQYKGIYREHIKTANKPKPELLIEFEIARLMAMLKKHENKEIVLDVLIRYLEDNGRLVRE